MAIIRIYEVPGGSTGSNARVSFEDGVEFPFTIQNPFSEDDEKQLSWYFEEYLNFPFINEFKAMSAALNIANYGEGLFKQVFANAESYARYQEYCQRGLNSLQIEIAGSPQFHTLHWEALKDPSQPQPLVLQATIVRKSLTSSVEQVTIQPSPTINLLLVTARPFGLKDVGYRTISRPLVEALHQAEIPVNIEILRPGTYRALERHLLDVSSQHGAGYYHVIHFDVHGAVLPYTFFQRQQQTDNFLIQQRYGRGAITEYEEAKAFLFLEGEHDAQADPVEASELATLLHSHQVPIVILNACQSGMQVGASETSLGSYLIMQAGVDIVLAMSNSLRVSAAELLMSTLYKQVSHGSNFSTAISYARQELYNHKGRKTSFNQTRDLEDWLLPVVYQNQVQQLHLSEFAPGEVKAYNTSKVKSYAPPQPSFGFMGRDLDVLQTERRLLTRRNLVLVRGMVGVGKTAFLKHLGTWWQRTGFVEQVFYFGYDKQTWSLQQILNTIAQQLFTEQQYLSSFQPESLEKQHALIIENLRNQRHLLLFDNLEAIRGTEPTSGNAALSEEQVALHRLLVDLVGSSTFVLLSSRGRVGWLADGTFSDNVYNLPGLDSEATSMLAGHILQQYEVTTYQQDAALLQTLKLLEGFPLALEVVLTNLSHHTPDEVFSALVAGDIALDRGDSQQRTQSILSSIDYSYSKLSSDVQRLLTCLAPFTSNFFMNRLEAYSGYLRQQPILAGFPLDNWAETIREADDLGLMSFDAKIPNVLHLHPMLPYFLRSQLVKVEQAEVRRAIDNAFCALYNQISMDLYSLLESKDVGEQMAGQMFMRLENENLMTALVLALITQVSIFSLYRALSRFLDATQDQQRILELDQIAQEGLDTYPPDKQTGQMGAEISIIFADIANRKAQLRHYPEAEALYQKSQTVLDQLMNVDEKWRGRMKILNFHSLGTLAMVQGQLDRATGYYKQAIKLSQNLKDPYNLANTYHNLGIVAQQQRQWLRAARCYGKALRIRINLKDSRQQAVSYINLGMLAEEQQQWSRATRYLRKALQIFGDFKDFNNQAKTYHNLGIVAQEQQQWKKSEQYYQQALQIRIALNDRYQQADTYYQLARMAEEQQQWYQGGVYLLDALERYIDEKDIAKCNMVLDSLHRLDRASGDAIFAIDLIAFMKIKKAFPNWAGEGNRIPDGGTNPGNG